MAIRHEEYLLAGGYEKLDPQNYPNLQLSRDLRVFNERRLKQPNGTYQSARLYIGKVNGAITATIGSGFFSKELGPYPMPSVYTTDVWKSSDGKLKKYILDTEMNLGYLGGLFGANKRQKLWVDSDYHVDKLIKDLTSGRTSGSNKFYPGKGATVLFDWTISK